MRTRSARRDWVWYTVLLALAACGEEDRTPTHFTPSSDRSATSTDDRTPPLTQVTRPPTDTTTPRAPPGLLTVAVLPPQGSGVSAQARLAPSSVATLVSLRLAGGLAGTTYDGAIHQGVCDGIGPATTSLVPATADSLGTGASASVIPVPLDSLLRLPHVVVIGKGGRAEACGPVGPTAAADSLPVPAP